MANDDLSGDFRRLIELMSYYLKGVRTALNGHVPVHNTLRDGFWPTSRIFYEKEDQMQDDGTLREKYVKDEPFIGRRCDRAPPSFRIGRDVYAGYFIVVCPVNDDDNKSFWLAKAFTNPNPDLGHVNMIQLQYWTPASGRHINMETYVGWDTKDRNVWREDRLFPPCWSNTGCIMTAWKPRKQKETSDARVKIPKQQIISGSLHV